MGGATARGPPVGTGGCLVPQPLRQLARGLLALPGLADVPHTPEAPGSRRVSFPLGPWVAHVPLFHNPLVLRKRGGGQLRVSTLHRRFPGLHGSGVLGSLGQAARVLAALSSPGLCAAAPGGHLAVLVPGGPASLGCTGWPGVRVALQALVACLDPAWWVFASASRQPSSTAARELAERCMLCRLGWLQQGGVLPVLLVQVSTRQATHLQLGGVKRLREERWCQFLRAVGHPGQTVFASEVGVLLQGLWGVRWDNQIKEPFWRLVYDAHPTPHRLHEAGRPCQCGAGLGGAAPLPGRDHSFWACPVAVAERAELQRALPAVAPLLTQAQLWLARAPAGVHQGVWFVVVLAAVRAMNKGRAALTGWRLAQGVVAPHPTAMPAAQQVEVAARVAVGFFWDGLQDYVGGGGWADCWGPASVQAPHPFIQRVGGALVVHVPP